MATVFTGVAAITAGLGPAAFAAENVTPATANGPEVCGANTGGISHWLHLFYPNDDHAAECVRTGSSTITATGTISAYCPGSTSGYLGGHETANGKYTQYDVYPGSNDRYHFITSHKVATDFNLESIYAFGREGGGKCTS
ncbi:MAG: acid shock protein [Trebonia sp.]